jgi:hypothetical protein
MNINLTDVELEMITRALDAVVVAAERGGQTRPVRGPSSDPHPAQVGYRAASHTNTEFE